MSKTFCELLIQLNILAVLIVFGEDKWYWHGRQQGPFSFKSNPPSHSKSSGKTAARKEYRPGLDPSLFSQ